MMFVFSGKSHLFPIYRTEWLKNSLWRAPIRHWALGLRPLPQYDVIMNRLVDLSAVLRGVSLVAGRYASLSNLNEY